MIRNILTGLGIAALTTPALAAPLEVISQVLVEQRVAAPDGTTRIELVTPKRVVPGDRVTYVLRYRNTGRQPISDLVLANPLPASLTYRGPHSGSPAPELSADGKSFGPLAGLRVAAASVSRTASTQDVTSVRWQLDQPLAAGAGGEFSFDAVVK